MCLFGFEEEPKLLMNHPSAASDSAKGKAFSIYFKNKHNGLFLQLRNQRVHPLTGRVVFEETTDQEAAQYLAWKS